VRLCGSFSCASSRFFRSACSFSAALLLMAATLREGFYWQTQGDELQSDARDRRRREGKLI
jgi:hypothetical protein